MGDRASRQPPLDPPLFIQLKWEESFSQMKVGSGTRLDSGCNGITLQQILGKDATHHNSASDARPQLKFLRELRYVA